jgi:hypothetical protein
MDEAAREEIGFRYALAEACDALLANERDRLERVRDELSRLPSRSRS